MKINKKPLLALIAVALIGIIGGTIAYFKTNATIKNIFSTATYQTTTTEEFNSPENWAPGQEVPKTIFVKNDGSIEVAVRLSYTEKWENSEGIDITTEDNLAKVTINKNDTVNWVYNNGYYYYKKYLKQNEVSTSFIKSVTLNANAITEDSSTCTETSDGKSKTCTAIDPLVGGKYTLSITTETVQADAANEVWNVNIEELN